MRGDFQPTPLCDARPGMVLAEGVRDANDHVLLAQGMVLTEQTLAALARHGIARLSVLQAAAPASSRDSTVMQARLDYLFRGNERDGQDGHDDCANGTLRRYIEDYRLQREVAP